MIIQDIVTRLYSTLPLLTNDFSDQGTVTTASNSGTTATCTSVGHGLATGNYIYIQAPTVQTPISSVVVLDNTATVTTSVDHDLTEEFHQSITISGSTSGINGTYPLKSVPNRRTFTFDLVIADGAYSSGSPVLHEDRYSVGGWKAVTVLSPNSFTVQSGYSGTYTYNSFIFHKNIRVAGAATYERAMEAYTKMAPGKQWAFCVLGRLNAQRSYKTASDAIGTSSGSSEFRQDLLQDFSVFVVSPSSTDMLARKVRDESGKYSSYIMRALLGHQVSSFFANDSQTTIHFLGHDFKAYNAAIYVHEIAFEAAEVITDVDLPSDTISRAFRDCNFRHLNDYIVSVIDTSTNLDDVPL